MNEKYKVFKKKTLKLKVYGSVQFISYLDTEINLTYISKELENFFWYLKNNSPPELKKYILKILCHFVLRELSAFLHLDFHTDPLNNPDNIKLFITKIFFLYF